MEKVLVVDDEQKMRDLCRRVLSAAGFAVRTAPSGAAALKELEKDGADVVLTDIHMPGEIDGEKLVEEVKCRFPWTDVVVMTGYPTVETAVPTLKRGAADYLTKPFDGDYLVNVVRRCGERRRLNRELERERALRRELEAAYAELQKVEELKEAFVSRVSHELRTPLVPAVMAMSAFESKITDPQVARLAHLARESLRRLQETVAQVLLFSDLSKSGEGAYRVECGLEEMLRAVVDKLRPRWEEKRLSVRVSSTGAAAPVWGTPRLLETAFTHLLANAVDFNRPGGSVEVEVAHSADYADVSVQDTGIGIPADKLPKVFDGFYQTASVLTREKGGLGLGLAIVRRIVERHGGYVSVRSREGQGTRFDVRLPRREAGVNRWLNGLRAERAESRTA